MALFHLFGVCMNSIYPIFGNLLCLMWGFRGALKRMSDESMLRLLRCKTEQIGEELGFCIELTEQAEQELLSISIGNLGLRHPLNKIRELALNTVSGDFFNDDFQNEIAAVRIESLENAVLVQPEIREMQVHRKKKYGIRNVLD